MGETFGVHLMLDGHGCDRSELESETFVYRFLDESPNDNGMSHWSVNERYRVSGSR